MKRRYIVPSIVILGLLHGCGQSWDNSHGKGDAPVGRTSDVAADVINMPDGYGNIATKCDPYQPGKRVYIVTHANSDVQPLIVDDPACGAATK